MLGEEKDVDVVTPDWREVLMADLDLHVRVRPDLVRIAQMEADEEDRRLDRMANDRKGCE